MVRSIRTTTPLRSGKLARGRGESQRLGSEVHQRVAGPSGAASPPAQSPPRLPPRPPDALTSTE